MTNKERFIELLNFNPRSHERSDGHRGKQRTCIRYFNPRSHERSDRADRGHQKDDGHFNPRSHERSDFNHTGGEQSMIISIHAPTRGATVHGSKDRSNRIHFNPRSHERSDDDHKDYKPVPGKFQSTLPREERRSSNVYGWVDEGTFD